MTRDQAQYQIVAEMEFGTKSIPFVLEYINDAIEYVATELRNIRVTETVTPVADQEAYTLVNTLIDYISCKWGNATGGWLPTLLGSKEAFVRTTDLASDRSYAWFENGTFNVFPLPSAADVSAGSTWKLDMFSYPALPSIGSSVIDVGGVMYEELFFAQVKYLLAGGVIRDPKLEDYYELKRDKKLKVAKARRAREEAPAARAVRMAWP